ncbi:MAG: aminoacyltransferase, partial [Chloroflexota bacterium]|nr:aminoacyltransferase [Chloroflexota bacterium]
MDGPATAMTVHRIGSDESQRWDAFIASSEHGHLFQSWGWGELKRRSGWRPLRLAVERGGRIEAAAQVLIRSTFGLSFAYVPRGPVVRPDQSDVYRRLLDAMHESARSRHCVFLKVEPNEREGSGVERLLRSSGFIRSPQTMQVRATMRTDITG